MYSFDLKQKAIKFYNKCKSIRMINIYFLQKNIRLRNIDTSLQLCFI